MCASEYVIYLILLYNNKRFQMKQKKTKNNRKKIE